MSSFECMAGKDSTIQTAEEGKPCKASDLDSWETWLFTMNKAGEKNDDVGIN